LSFLGDKVYIAKTRTKKRLDCLNVGLIAFGIGITEMRHTVKELLSLGKNVTLIHSVKSCNEKLFHDEFIQLSSHYPKFKLHYVVSKDNGRITPDLLKDWFDFPLDARFLVIGSKQMMRDAYKMLNEIGYHLKLLKS
jgi:NAD(P)H-flavin reductase